MIVRKDRFADALRTSGVEDNPWGQLVSYRKPRLNDELRAFIAREKGNVDAAIFEGGGVFVHNRLQTRWQTWCATPHRLGHPGVCVQGPVHVDPNLDSRARFPHVPPIGACRTFISAWQT
mgnify:CR=1 FL=1|eukprot:scaffold282588_cov28-Tisochrysis_lutea.AAC.3